MWVGALICIRLSSAYFVKNVFDSSSWRVSDNFEIVGDQLDVLRRLFSLRNSLDGASDADRGLGCQGDGVIGLTLED